MVFENIVIAISASLLAGLLILYIEPSMKNKQRKHARYIIIDQLEFLAEQTTLRFMDENEARKRKLTKYNLVEQFLQRARTTVNSVSLVLNPQEIHHLQMRLQDIENTLFNIKHNNFNADYQRMYESIASLLQTLGKHRKWDYYEMFGKEFKEYDPKTKFNPEYIKR